MRPTTRSALALALAASLALPLAAPAQTPPSPPPPPPEAPQRHGWDPAAAPDHRGAERSARAAERIKDLHDILAIRPEQESAFQAFAAAMAPPTGPGPGAEDWGKPGERGGPGAHARPTTPERVDMMLDRFDKRAARMREAMRRRGEAVKTLYAALDPRQQRALDALPGLVGGDWGGPGGGGRWRGPRGGEGGPGRMGAGQ